MDNRHVRSMKLVLLVSSLASIALFAYAAYDENFKGEWRDAQARYRSLLMDTASNDSARRAAASFAVEHKQLFLAELASIDRCTTCHLGVENPNMKNAEPPLTTHPGQFLIDHPIEKFGCTVCHQGQGRAVGKEAAHGWHADGTLVAHTESPLLRGQAVYTSCGKCHYETDLFGGLADLHAHGESSKVAVSIDENHLQLSLPGAVEVARGKDLLINSGCLGCHKYRGRGGVLGPDITYVGDKTKHDFDFSHVQGEHTVEQWLFEHFMFPEEVSPGTVMPDMAYSEKDARALTSYMMSLHRKSAPASHRPQPFTMMASAARPVRGETLYNMFCSSCHGIDGQGSTMRTGLWPVDADPWGHNWDARDIVIETRGDMEVFVPSLNHADTLAVVSDEYLHQVIAQGRPGTKMLAWQSEGGLTDDEVTLLVNHIRRWQPKGAVISDVSTRAGDPKIGEVLYRANCAACHGADGEGALAVSLNSPTFLAVASDQFLRDTIIHGRPGTAMLAWREFNAREVSDLIAFMRQSWQPQRANKGTVLQLCDGINDPHVSADIGRTLYEANCIMCHGDKGQGELGPSLNTEEFLTIASDEYLVTTIMDGRPSTAMPSWRHLPSKDIASIVQYLRTWQEAPNRFEELHVAPVELGDAQLGAIHFTGHCAGCHGPNAEGATGPQLSNPVFLESASDNMLKKWIAYGKSNTEMRAFRKGGQGIVELSERHIDDIVAYIRSLEQKTDDEINRLAKYPHGRPEKGAALYVNNCAGCHGDRGQGASGPALSNRNFLRYASDGFILATLALGRHGTEMRPVKSGPQSILELTSDEVNDIVAFLRSWEYDSPYASQQGLEVAHRFVVPWDLHKGRELYASNCAGCHGVEGKGAWAPELNNEGFLAAATDGFLQATIVRGRHATAMRPFGKGSHGVVELSSDEVDDIVAYMRSWSKSTPSPLTLPAERSIAHHTAMESLQTAQSEPDTTSNDHSPDASGSTLTKEHDDER